jgi:two-component system, OmpR family, response regulator
MGPKDTLQTDAPTRSVISGFRLQPNEGGRIGAEKGAGGDRMKPFSVLVVDDEEDFVDAIVDRLRDRGLETEGVSRGKDALELLNQRDFDVCILDVMMPGMDGIETLREMKEKKPSLAVIMLTAHGSVDSGLQGLQLGAYNYLIKPFPFEDLLAQLSLAYEHKLIDDERSSSGSTR